MNQWEYCLGTIKIFLAKTNLTYYRFHDIILLVNISRAAEIGIASLMIASCNYPQERVPNSDLQQLPIKRPEGFTGQLCVDIVGDYSWNPNFDLLIEQVPRMGCFEPKQTGSSWTCPEIIEEPLLVALGPKQIKFTITKHLKRGSCKWMLSPRFK